MTNPSKSEPKTDASAETKPWLIDSLGSGFIRTKIRLWKSPTVSQLGKDCQQPPAGNHDGFPYL